MENGARNGVRSTNHDRDLKVNGINGGGSSSTGNKAVDMVPVLNGAYDGTISVSKQQGQGNSNSSEKKTSMDQLPEEIQHITQNFKPLTMILQRLAQKSHNDLQKMLMDMANMEPPKGLVNGSVNGFGAPEDDTSEENINKKSYMLHCVQDMHAKWVKALVMTQWSRKANLVSKLIDIKAHYAGEMLKYGQGLDYLAIVKKGLNLARLPDPDIKTALQILATGEAPWMPEIGYIDPPPLTAQEQLKWIDDLNTLLSVRLNLDDHDKIPPQFSDYSISSGRVTFRVQEEFEVDLTIADEDFEKQFWFIDFRFLFSPAPQELSEVLRTFLELKVNETLLVDGLGGCYRFLHEFVLTHKINELMRQAVELSHGRWVDTIKVERLNRAISIQYWASRFPHGPKNWIIIGVHSGRKSPSSGARSTSFLCLRWFRNGKEVKDVEIPIDAHNVSTERLLKSVIAKHVEHILSGVHGKLLTKPKFAKRDTATLVSVDSDEPSESCLSVQLTHSEKLKLRIDCMTGMISMAPHSPIVARIQQHLNHGAKDVINEAVPAVEAIRSSLATEELKRRGRSMGWRIKNAHPQSPPVKTEDVRNVINTREKYTLLWFNRDGWDPRWYLLISLSLSGDTWWLIEAKGTQANADMQTHFALPTPSGHPEFSDTFFTNLTTVATAMMCQLSDQMVLHTQKIRFARDNAPNPFMSPRISLPTLFVKLGDVIPSRKDEPASKKSVKRPWANEWIQITFRGVQNPLPGGPVRVDRRLRVTAEAKVHAKDKSKLSLLRGSVDHDVMYNARSGTFLLRLRSEVGKPIVDILVSRLQAIDRLVEFVAAIQTRGAGVECESVTLRKVIFTYGDLIPIKSAEAPALGQQSHRWRVVLDLTRADKINIILEKGNPHLRILDMLLKLVKSEIGFESLPFWLTMTLPLLRGVEAIQDSWEDIEMNAQGSFQVFHKAIDWCTLQFQVPGAAGQPRRLLVDIRLSLRKGEHHWRAYRTNDSIKKSDTSLNPVIQSIWDAKGEVWQGMRTMAVTKTTKDVGVLLEKISETMKALVVNKGPSSASTNINQSKNTGMTKGAPVVLD